MGENRIGMSEPVSAIDGARLIAEVRRGDEEALRRAYQVTFGHDLGRLVLAHHLQECGVGNALGTDDLKYRAGKHDGALQLALKAGFDQAAVAVAVLTDELEERADEGSSVYYDAALDDDLDG
jgi:hypothetical protein